MKNLLLVFGTMLCLVLVSCGSDCQDCTFGTESQEVCEDTYEDLAAADGLETDSLTFEAYIAFVEAFGFVCE